MSEQINAHEDDAALVAALFKHWHDEPEVWQVATAESNAINQHLRTIEDL